MEPTDTIHSIIAELKGYVDTELHEYTKRPWSDCEYFDGKLKHVQMLVQIMVCAWIKDPSGLDEKTVQNVLGDVGDVVRSCIVLRGVETTTDVYREWHVLSDLMRTASRMPKPVPIVNGSGLDILRILSDGPRTLDQLIADGLVDVIEFRQSRRVVLTPRGIMALELSDAPDKDVV